MRAPNPSVMRAADFSKEHAFMRNINLRYVEETYDEAGRLAVFRRALPRRLQLRLRRRRRHRARRTRSPRDGVVQPEGERHTFTFGDMKTWSDKTANFLADSASGAATSSWSSCAATTSSGSSRPRSRNSGGGHGSPRRSCSKSTISPIAERGGYQGHHRHLGRDIADTMVDAAW